MNKLELKGLPSGRRAIWKNGIKAKQALIIDERFPDTDGIMDFFDLVIVCDEKHLDRCPNPDIFVHCSTELDKNGELALPNTLARLEKSLIVVHKEAVKKMRARNLKPSNYMVETTKSVCTDACREFLHENGVQDDKIWLVNDEDLVSFGGTRLQQKSFFNAVDKYKVLVNRRFKDRKLLMEK